MENTLDFATNGAMSPATYANSFQGHADLDYQPISSKPATPPAATNDTKDQAARLRALLSSHLSEGGSGNSQATGADRLEALIDMLYAMTAPAEASTAAAPVAPEVKSAETPVAAAYTVTLPEPIKDTPSPEPQNADAALSPRPEPLPVESALVPAPSVEAPTAQMSETAFAPAAPLIDSIEVEAPVAQVAETAFVPASEEIQNSAAPSIPTPVMDLMESAPAVVAEAQAVAHVAEPEATEAHPLEALQTGTPHAEAHQSETPQLEDPQEQAQWVEMQPVAEETATEIAKGGETFSIQEAQTAPEPDAFTPSSFIEDSPPVFAVGEALPDDAQALPRVSAKTTEAMTEVLTMEEKSALLNPLKEERGTTSGNITFNFVTDKSTATLNIPMQANLNQITFEQRLDEIILKIHLSL